LGAVAYRVRAATPDDADELGSIHVRAWQAAYRGGLLPDAYLDSLSEEARAAMWRLGLEEGSTLPTLVAEAEDGTVAGFIVVGPAAGEGDGSRATGEVHAINVDPDHWNQGAGCDLLATGVDALSREHFRRAVLWVHPGNAGARRFFEIHGWARDREDRRQEVLGVELEQTRYSRPLE
jgi:L-amino acid N-acyltransferase YncA